MRCEQLLATFNSMKIGFQDVKKARAGTEHYF